MNMNLTVILNVMYQIKTPMSKFLFIVNVYVYVNINVNIIYLRSNQITHHMSLYLYNRKYFVTISESKLMICLYVMPCHM